MSINKYRSRLDTLTIMGQNKAAYVGQRDHLIWCYITCQAECGNKRDREILKARYHQWKTALRKELRMLNGVAKTLHYLTTGEKYG